jgi:hypothetical protein
LAGCSGLLFLSPPGNPPPLVQVPSFLDQRYFSLRQEREAVSDYWDNNAFLETLALYQKSPSAALETDLIELFLIPLARGYWARYKKHYALLDSTEALADAVAVCWIKLGNFNPARGSGLNYFSTVIQRHLEYASERAGVYRSRYVFESEYELSYHRRNR